jgi:hypothetical protein
LTNVYEKINIANHCDLFHYRSYIILAQDGNFPYAQYERFIKRYVKSDMTIKGMNMNSADYTALSQDASKFLILSSPKRISAFDPRTLESWEQKNVILD